MPKVSNIDIIPLLKPIEFKENNILRECAILKIPCLAYKLIFKLDG
jgi:hypothetical protein